MAQFALYRYDNVGKNLLKENRWEKYAISRNISGICCAFTHSLLASFGCVCAYFVITFWKPFFYCIRLFAFLRKQFYYIPPVDLQFWHTYTSFRRVCLYRCNASQTMSSICSFSSCGETVVSLTTRKVIVWIHDGKNTLDFMEILLSKCAFLLLLLLLVNTYTNTYT